ncbi:MAG: prepilin-type N-terminal cleavage/methylation domain-containing protein [Pseudomonadota bacterium]
MPYPTPQSDGFTLVEVIASLLLVGILASVAGMFIVTGIKGYETATTASEGALKAQIAINRMYAELTGIDPTQTITVVTDTSIAYTHAVLTPNLTRTLSYDSAQKRINLTTTGGTYPLIGDISAFKLSAAPADGVNLNNGIAYVDIEFNIAGIGGIRPPFKLTAFPRNLSNMP